MLEGLQMYWQLKYNTPFKIIQIKFVKVGYSLKCKKLEESGEWKKENIEIQEVGKTNLREL